MHVRRDKNFCVAGHYNRHARRTHTHTSNIFHHNMYLSTQKIWYDIVWHMKLFHEYVYSLYSHTNIIPEKNIRNTLSKRKIKIRNIWPFKAYWSRDAPTVYHSKTVRSAHTVFMCFVFIWEQTATCATYIINWLVFITEMKSVYCAVRTGSLNKAVYASSLKG